MIFADRPHSAGAINNLFQLFRGNTEPACWLLSADVPDSRLFLFILHNGPHAAGILRRDGLGALSIREFFAALAAAAGARLTLEAMNPLLYKSLLVAIQKRPTAAGSTDLLNLEHLLQRMKSAGHEAVVTLRAADELNLCYILDAQLHEAFFARPEAVTPDAAPEEQFLEYGFSATPQRPVWIQAYEDARIEPADDADLAWDEWPLGIMEYFLRPRPIMTFAPDGRAPVRLAIDTRRFRIGRDSASDLVVRDSLASREHAVVRETGGEFLLEDLASRNGTLLNGVRIDRPMPLHDGDEIGIGALRLQFVFKVEPPRAAPTHTEELETTMLLMDEAILQQALKPPQRPHSLRLEMLTGAQKGAVLTLSDKTVIGRSHADINTDDPKVSRRHAAIERRSDGYYLTDLNSTNGSFINDHKVADQRLIDGDLIRVGDAVFKILPGA